MKNYIGMTVWAVIGLTVTNYSSSWLSITIAALSIAMGFKNLKGIIYGRN